MAKRSIGGYMALLLGQLAFAAYRNYKDKKTALEGDYRTALRESQQQHSGQQAEYEAYVNELPKLIGDGSFTLVVDTSTGDKFALESFTQYLDIMHPGEQVLTALLSTDRDDEPTAIAVELSQAHVGYIPASDLEQMLAPLQQVGGDVTCNAKLRRLNYGDTYQLLLDIKLPLQFEGV